MSEEISYPYTSYGETVNVYPYRAKYYDNNNTAIELIVADGPDEGQQQATISVNIAPLPPDRIAVDTNNSPGAEKFLTENHLGEPIGISLKSGFCSYPIYRLNLDKFPPYPEY